MKRNWYDIESYGEFAFPISGLIAALFVEWLNHP